MRNALAGTDTPCFDGMTIAERIAVKTAGQITREIIRALVDEIVLVRKGRSKIANLVLNRLAIHTLTIAGIMSISILDFWATWVD